MEGDLAYSEVFGVPEKIDPLTTDRKARADHALRRCFCPDRCRRLMCFPSVRYVFDKDVNLWPTRLTRVDEPDHRGRLHPCRDHDGCRADLQPGAAVPDRCRFGQQDDTLPYRMLHEPLPEGPGKGQVVELDEMLPEVLPARGWDENGVPTKEKLAELGLAN